MEASKASIWKRETNLVDGKGMLSVPLGGIGNQFRVCERSNHLTDGPVFLRQGAYAGVGCGERRQGKKGGREEGMSGTG